MSSQGTSGPIGDEMKKDITDLSSELLEVGIDQILDEGILRDIPILGTAIRIADIAKSVRDRLFLYKVQLFLNASDRISQAEREKFKQKLDNEPEFREKVGETLLLIIERLDSLEKPALLARLFSHLIRENITLSEFRRLAYAIDIAFIDDLRFLMLRFGQIDNRSFAPLVRSGLAEINPNINRGQENVFGMSTDYISFRISDLGKLFTRIMTDNHRNT